jgi:hypothetical protein
MAGRGYFTHFLLYSLCSWLFLGLPACRLDVKHSQALLTSWPICLHRPTELPGECVGGSFSLALCLHPSVSLSLSFFPSLSFPTLPLPLSVPLLFSTNEDKVESNLYLRCASYGHGCVHVYPSDGYQRMRAFPIQCVQCKLISVDVFSILTYGLCTFDSH